MAMKIKLIVEFGNILKEINKTKSHLKALIKNVKS